MEKKTKLGIFYNAKGAGGKFLSDIIKELSKVYDLKIFEINNYYEVEKGMEMVEVCWFEWCDSLLQFASRLAIARDKKIVTRLHRYEVFTSFPAMTNWNNIDGLILVTNHLRHLLPTHLPSKVEIRIIENGVDIDKFTYKERKKGYNIGFIADLIPRKNPILLLQIIDRLVKIDKRYKLFVAGAFKDELIKLYWDYTIDELNLKENVIFDGWQTNINEWLEDKNYILSTSIHESFGYNIAEAMVKGIKPVIYNFPYSKEIWDQKYLFNTIDEAVSLITEDNYVSYEYRDFVEKRYSLKKEIEQIIYFLEYIEKKPVVKSVKVEEKNSTRDVVIFGASTLGRAAYEICKNRYKVLFFCDNDQNKWNCEIDGIKIIPPTYLQTLAGKVDVIIASSFYQEIHKQLMDMSINNCKVLFFNLNELGE